MEDIELNPWISVWTEARATIRQIVNRDPRYLVLVLAPLAGIADALTRNSALAYSSLEAFAGLVLVGAIVGLLFLYLFAYLARWTGRWLGGTGSLVSIRAAYVWSSLPKILSAILLLCAWGVAGLVRAPIADLDLAVTLMIVTLGCWSAVIHCQCLGEVQGFSAWKGLANSILALLVFLVPIIVIAIVISVVLNQ